MNFFDYSFIFLFLPIVVAGARLTRFLGQSFQYIFLICASITFYATWNTAAPFLLFGSVVFNYGLGRLLFRHPQRAVLCAGVAINLGLLGYYKYSGFFLDNVRQFMELPGVAQVVLPLGISFFTFQQISYLVDSYRRETGPHTGPSYVLFITLFPHLIAGPIVLQSDVLRQLNHPSALRISKQYIATGFAMFILGLGKKIVVADSFAAFASPLFAKAGSEALSLSESWQAALAYTFQIYFALCLGVRLPFNFNSPYKSQSITDFWRRWHMSLSRFLRHYLYVPLGGNRRGTPRTLVNIMVVMMLGGMWHGANWTFLAWGALHGFFLLVNRVWRQMPDCRARAYRGSNVVGWLATFAAVVFAWVLFRAPDIQTAVRIWQAMVGLQAGMEQPLSATFWLMAIAAAMACITLPNSQQLVLHIDDRASSSWRGYLSWRPNAAWGLTLGMLLALVIVWTWHISSVPEFIYFNF
jgi:alginate O-acetyltransferase complex protein AlgI